VNRARPSPKNNRRRDRIFAQIGHGSRRDHAVIVVKCIDS